MYQLRRNVTASCAVAMVADAASAASAPMIDLNFMLPSLGFSYVSVTSVGCCETCHGMVMRSMISTT